MSLEYYESEHADDDREGTYIPVIMQEMVDLLEDHTDVDVDILHTPAGGFAAILFPRLDDVCFKLSCDSTGRTSISWGTLVEGSFVADGTYRNLHDQKSGCKGYLIVVNGGAVWQLGIPGRYAEAGATSQYAFALLSCFRLTPQLATGSLTAFEAGWLLTDWAYPKFVVRGDTSTHIVRIQDSYHPVKFWTSPTASFNLRDDNVMMYPTPLYTDVHVGNWGAPTIGSSPVFYAGGEHGITAYTEFLIGETPFVCLGQCCIRST